MPRVDTYFETIIGFLKSRKGVRFADGYASLPKFFSIEMTPVGIRLDNCRVYEEAELDTLMNVIVERVARYERTVDNQRRNIP